MLTFRDALNSPHTVDPATAYWIGSREIPHGGPA